AHAWPPALEDQDVEAAHQPAPGPRRSVPDRRPVARSTCQARSARSADPAFEEFGPAFGPLLGGDRIADVVLPRAVDLEIAQGGGLITQAELVHGPVAVVVPGHDTDVDPVERELRDREPHRDHNPYGDVGVSGVSPVDPVPA